MKIVNYSFLTVLFVGLMLGASVAQQSPIVSSYFQNDYLFNSAQIGVNGTKAVDAIIRMPVGQLKDDMKENYLHVMYGFGRNGVGAGFRTNRVGAFNLTELNASYAFHLPLDGDSKFLSMGTSIKFLREQINTDKIVGDPNDPAIAYYNNDPNRMDFNLGLAYNSDNVVVSLAVNNLLKERHNFLVNPTPFIYSSVRYNLLFEDVSVSPVVAYRRMLNDQDIFDFGTSVGFDQLFSTYLFYHTSKNFSAGISTKVKNVYFNLGYATTTAGVQGIGRQGLDIGLRYAW
ncbi:type IX secretion system membrane protein PorP/SprF [Sphingobacterium alkalisoli]|uniref:Type IX secretion system membrane protein PorP/SprF n=1 Tax=Sphingobacterium alkalisoli TaxID=1874115 RepID=A0A4U0H9G1_9SPHI|nr:PorP/SprF family type IX secretion system membrane protein [Sphingobacterium alkalisoli]TJY68490.1 type IX secretion system membrane protein PorP/SprF [Sphingobacterium alkalisoli]GGH06129.1 hypothetical protein GCM10011418_02680 [Sphingobacterium alkalisoli]